MEMVHAVLGRRRAELLSELAGQLIVDAFPAHAHTVGVIPSFGQGRFINLGGHQAPALPALRPGLHSL